jgi:hypothetical protein
MEDIETPKTYDWQRWRDFIRQKMSMDKWSVNKKYGERPYSVSFPYLDLKRLQYSVEGTRQNSLTIQIGVIARARRQC